MNITTIEIPKNAFSPASKSRYAKIPISEDFEGRDFKSAPDLEEIAKRLIFRHSCFSHLREVPILYSWKCEGGGTGGRLALGRCAKLSGKESFLCEGRYEFVIWCAADNCRNNSFTEFQLEALVFHELSHIKEVDYQLKIQGHDCELFYGEIEHYGLWKRDLRGLEQLKQGSLF